MIHKFHPIYGVLSLKMHVLQDIHFQYGFFVCLNHIYVPVQHVQHMSYVSIMSFPHGSLDPESSHFVTKCNACTMKLKLKDIFLFAGGLAIGVPGEVKGYHEAWQQFGLLPWRTLFTQSIRLCREGVLVDRNLVSAIQRVKKSVEEDDGMRCVHICM